MAWTSLYSGVPWSPLTRMRSDRPIRYCSNAVSSLSWSMGLGPVLRTDAPNTMIASATGLLAVTEEAGCAPTANTRRLQHKTIARSETVAMRMHRMNGLNDRFDMTIWYASGFVFS